MFCLFATNTDNPYDILFYFTGKRHTYSIYIWKSRITITYTIFIAMLVSTCASKPFCVEWIAFWNFLESYDMWWKMIQLGTGLRLNLEPGPWPRLGLGLGPRIGLGIIQKLEPGIGLILEPILGLKLILSKYINFREHNI